MEPHDRAATIRTYRIYFLGLAGRIEARQDFHTEDDERALVIASLLFDACSDACEGFALWEGTRQLPSPAPGRYNSADQINRAAQEQALEAEIAMQDSNWAISSSRRLLEQTARLRARLRGEN